MSEQPVAQEQGGGNFLTHRYGGIPGVVWLAGAAVIAYFLFFRNKGSSTSPTSTGGGGTSTTGDITLQPGTETIDLGSPTGNTVTNPAPVTSNTGGSGSEDEDNEPGNPGQPGHRPNPQPTPKPPGRTKSHHKKIQHKAGQPQFVTVTKWPGQSVNGLAQWSSTLSGIAGRYHTTVPDLLKLNPSIKNPNLVFPGEKVRVK
jgi:hypothetical protein